MLFTSLTFRAPEAHASAAGCLFKGWPTGRKPFAALFALALVCLLAPAAAVKAQTGDEGFIGPPLIISEFRLSGPENDLDEFVEIYNNSDNAVIVNTEDGSPGFALVASDGVVRFHIPNGTMIPARGHFLGVNSAGYSLSAYSSGNGRTANGDASYTHDIPENAGIALFASSDPSRFIYDYRLDAVGSDEEANALYREGAGYPSLFFSRLESSFVRRLCSAPTTCTGLPRDTGNNAADFIYVETNHNQAGAGQRLGAPGPEGLSSPVRRRGTGIVASLLDPLVDAYTYPNYFRDHSFTGGYNAAFGTIGFRRTFTNNTGTDITALRFRVADITTAVQPPEVGDLRPRTSGAVTVTLSDGRTTTVQGTTLEEPPPQGGGTNGGFNSSLAAGTVTLATPLAPGASLDLQFVAGVEQTGDFRYCLTLETLPASGSEVLCFDGNTETGRPTPTPTPTPMPTPTPTPTPTATPTPTPLPTPQVGCTMSFSNPVPMVFRYTGAQPGTAMPYPSSVAAAGFLGPVQKVTVRLSDLSHTYPRSIDVLLVSPDGRSAVIMSDVSTGEAVTGVTLTLDDEAPEPLPIYERLTSGRFKPRNRIDGIDSFPAPAPATDGRESLSVFKGAEANGVWSLYVVNDPGFFTGQFAGGWSLEITAGCPNNAPVARDDSYEVNQDTALSVPAPGVLADDADADGDALAATLVSGPSHGLLTLNRDGSFTYTPDAHFTGADSFTYRADDGEDSSNVATVSIDVRDTEAPALTASVAVASLRQRDSTLVNVGLSASASDNDGQPVRIGVEVFGDEDDEAPTSPGVVNSPDARDIAPGTLRLRAERADTGDGRVYLVVVTATDAAGNTSRRVLTVVVPKSQSDRSAEAVSAQAEAARQYAEANDGAPPPGYFPVGDGPVIGPYQ